MVRHVLALVLTGAFLTVASAPVTWAQTPPAAKAEKKAAKKEPTEKQKAARQRMRECGAQWRQMKKEGKAKGTTWRKFSAECLKRKTG